MRRFDTIREAWSALGSLRELGTYLDLQIDALASVGKYQEDPGWAAQRNMLRRYSDSVWAAYDILQALGRPLYLRPATKAEIEKRAPGRQELQAVYADLAVPVGSDVP